MADSVTCQGAAATFTDNPTKMENVIVSSATLAPTGAGDLASLQATAVMHGNLRVDLLDNAGVSIHNFRSGNPSNKMQQVDLQVDLVPEGSAFAIALDNSSNLINNVSYEVQASFVSGKIVARWNGRIETLVLCWTGEGATGSEIAYEIQQNGRGFYELTLPFLVTNI